MSIKIFLLLFVAYGFILETNSCAHDMITKDSTAHIKLLRFIDTKEEYGKSCETYTYISSMQRLQLLKKNTFMFGDILKDTLSITSVNPDHIVGGDLNSCNMQDMDISEFTYKEQLSYLNENIITIEVSQYAYGAGAAHGNRHISHYMYDREYGMKLDWENLFGEDETFDKYVFMRVVEEIADEDFITYFQANDQLFNFRIPGYFAITNEGLLIQYGKYEITPGASGLPSITVPKEILKQYMSKAMYEKCFPQNFS